jgi:hypothetical protein
LSPKKRKRQTDDFRKDSTDDHKWSENVGARWLYTKPKGKKKGNAGFPGRASGINISFSTKRINPYKYWFKLTKALNLGLAFAA